MRARLAALLSELAPGDLNGAAVIPKHVHKPIFYFFWSVIFFGKDSGLEGCTNFTLFDWKLSLDIFLFDVLEMAGSFFGGLLPKCHIDFSEILTHLSKKPVATGGFLFPSSGGEANDCAIRLARLYTGELTCGPLRW